MIAPLLLAFSLDQHYLPEMSLILSYPIAASIALGAVRMGIRYWKKKGGITTGVYDESEQPSWQ